MAKVVTSAKWKYVRDGCPGLLAEAAEYVLRRYLSKYAVEDFARHPWGNLKLSAGYARRKAKMGAVPIGDLFVTGGLRREFIVETQKRVENDGKNTASTYISGNAVPGAAALNYGYSARNLPPRKFVRLQEHRTQLARDLRALILAKINAGGTT